MKKLSIDLKLLSPKKKDSEVRIFCTAYFGFPCNEFHLSSSTLNFLMIGIFYSNVFWATCSLFCFRNSLSLAQLFVIIIRQKFLTEPFFQKFYFLFLKILNKKENKETWTICFEVRISRKRNGSVKNSCQCHDNNWDIAFLHLIFSNIVQKWSSHKIKGRLIHFWQVYSMAIGLQVVYL